VVTEIGKTPMVGRPRDEEGRSATTLELFFDLVFVVAVAFAANALHHGLGENTIWEAIIRFAQVFFAIWWAWMNFTWFASAFDTDDVPYRLTIFVAITGALLLAAGVPDAFENGDFTLATIGYVVMRLALVSLWLRAAHSDVDHAATAYRFASGVSLAQVGWVALLFAPASIAGAGFVFLVILELLVPVWAERATPTPWHPEHIEERYGLFTIIVLGESILASSTALQEVTADTAGSVDLILVVIGGLLTVFSMWWLYFERPRRDLLVSLRRAFIWGYGHYFVWAAAAAVGAGLSVAIDHAGDHGSLGDLGAEAAVAFPVSIYLLAMWVLHYVPRASGRFVYSLTAPLAALLILATPLTGRSVLLTGIILATLLAIKLTRGRRQTT
jgi:low temperature requirement protein LtrA